MTKSCSLKSKQKVFLLNQSKAASCCKSYHEQFDSNLDDLLEKWNKESVDLDLGIEVPSCEVCWTDEHRGKQSMRQELSHLNIEHRIELSISNLCNHMCGYCSPKFSSMWEQSIVEHGEFTKVSRSALNNLAVVSQQSDIENKFDQVVDHINSYSNNQIVLCLLGGEPLMQHHSLEKIFSIDPAKIKQLVFNTNLNPPSNKFLLRLIEQFPVDKLLLHVSIDATPEFNHVPRHGFDSNRFLSNLEILKHHNVAFDFMPVASVLSVFDLHNFLTWCKRIQVTCEIQALNNPNALQIRHIPLEIRQELLSELHTLPEHLVWELSCPSSSKIEQFEQYQYLKQYFDRTNPDLTHNPGFDRWWKRMLHEYR